MPNFQWISMHYGWFPVFDFGLAHFTSEPFNYFILLLIPQSTIHSSFLGHISLNITHQLSQFITDKSKMKLEKIPQCFCICAWWLYSSSLTALPVATEEYGGALFYKSMNIRGCNPNRYNYVERLHFYQVDVTTLYNTILCHMHVTSQCFLKDSTKFSSRFNFSWWGNLLSYLFLSFVMCFSNEKTIG